MEEIKNMEEKEEITLEVYIPRLDPFENKNYDYIIKKMYKQINFHISVIFHCMSRIALQGGMVDTQDLQSMARRDFYNIDFEKYNDDINIKVLSDLLREYQCQEEYWKAKFLI